MRARIAFTLAAAILAAGVPDGGSQAITPAFHARAKAVLTTSSGQPFKDLNGNGTLDPYEDWRLPAERRAADLVSRMTLDEKAGMMLIDTLNAPAASSTISSTNAARLINEEKMTRFVFRNTVAIGGAPAASGPAPGGVAGFAGATVTPQQAAEFTNAVQELAEATRLGIPALFKSNARNHYDRSARAGINEPAGSFSEWPKEAGLAATRDMALIASFGDTMGAEWNAIGLRGMYGYMADLSTEPRWNRVHETFTEDADLAGEIITTLVKSLQGGPVSRTTRVALTIKHFPGGGPQEMGLDPHYTHGKNQVYPSGNFEYHLKPFRAAIDAGASAIMPYYGVPIGVTYDGVSYEHLGMAFSRQIVTDLLRVKLGFKGYVNSDTGIVDQRGWGLEKNTIPSRVATAVNAGVDILSGFNRKDTILDLVKTGLVRQARVDEAVTRLLIEQFRLGLFEDPYVDASLANGTVGKDEFRRRALDAQRKSIVLLKNQDRNALPLRPTAPGRPVRLYTMGLNAEVVAGSDYGGYMVTTAEPAAGGTTRTPVPRDTDHVVIRVEVTNPRSATGSYRSKDPATGGRINPATGRAWGADDPDSIDDGLRFGGALPWEASMLDFSQMARAQSWQISPPLLDIQAAFTEIGDAKKVILCIYFRQPYVLDDASGLKRAGAILANFGVSDRALMDVLTGRFKPQGKLPFALANTPEAILRQHPDAPGYAAADTLHPFGFGLSY